MKNVLTAPVRLWQLIVVVAVVAALSSTLVASASPLAAFLTPGAFRLTWATATDSTSVTVPKGYASYSVLQTTITVPTGKHADLAVIGEVDMEGGAATGYQYCFGQIRLDNITTGTQFKPGNYILEGFNPPANNLSVPINGVLANVAAGKHTIYMVMQAGYADCIALDRSMIIVANVH